ncbi:MAG: hypothetical protein N4A35_10180 [Flavobacteriales bacterium]|jgi:hypothetical protein|nr:hypothetical protein [Flavobacteriales bacterium]
MKKNKYFLFYLSLLFLAISCSSVKYYRLGNIEISMEKVDYKLTKLDYEVFGVAIETFFKNKNSAIKVLTSIDSTYYNHSIVRGDDFSKIAKEISDELSYEHLIINKKSYPIKLRKLIEISVLPIDSARNLSEDSVAYIRFSKPVYDDSLKYSFFIFERFMVL